MLAHAAQLMTVAEVANRLHLSRSMVYLLIQRGELPVIKIGKATRIAPEAIDDFLARVRQVPAVGSGRV